MAIAPSGVPWTSLAAFAADGDGAVDLATAAPIEGTYSESDVFGLLWSLAPEKLPSAPFSTDRGVTIGLAATSDGVTSATVDLFRGPVVQGLTERIPAEDTGIVGRLFVPDRAGRLGGVILIGGTNGGISLRGQAALLASHGYVTFALAYCGAPMLPTQARRIPLEYFVRAIDWFEDQAQVDRERLALMGVSAGATAAMLVAVRDVRVKAIVGWSGSTVPLPGAGRGITPAWTWEGQPVRGISAPSVSIRSIGSVRREVLAFGRSLRRNLYATQADRMRELMEGQHLDAVAIPLQEARAASLLIAGEDDPLVPVEFVRATKNAEVVTYPGAGHISPPPGAPATPYRTPTSLKRDAASTGGTAAANAAATRDGWARTLHFLDAQVGPATPLRQVVANWAIAERKVATVRARVRVEASADEGARIEFGFTFRFALGSASIVLVRRGGGPWAARTVRRTDARGADLSEDVRVATDFVDLTRVDIGLDRGALVLSLEGDHVVSLDIDEIHQATVSLVQTVQGVTREKMTATWASLEAFDAHGNPVPLSSSDATGLNTQAACLTFENESTIRTEIDPTLDPGSYVLVGFDPDA